MEHLMTSEEVAEFLHVDPVTIRRLVNKNELAAYRIGADYRFSPEDLQDYLQRQRIPAQPKNAAEAPANSPFEQLGRLIRSALLGKNTTPAEVADRFKHFTKRALIVLDLSREEAQRFQHNYIGTEHLLLGLVREGEGVAGQVLTNLGVELSKVRSAVEVIIGRGGRIVLGEIGLTPRAKKVIELAVDEARRLNHRFIGTEHLLLGLVREGEGIAAGVLVSLGVNLEKVRAETSNVLGQQHTSEDAPVIPPIPVEATALLTEQEQALVCTYCSACCPTYFHYCFNCGQQLYAETPGQTD